MKNENIFLSSPLAGGTRRTGHFPLAPCGRGKGEGYQRGQALCIPLIGFECLRTQNHFPRRGGSQTAKGFTLIELLVVVLIIGILASVALPQYQKAVEKARMTEAIMLVRTIADANKAHYMATGQWADHGDLELLDIEVPGSTTQYGPGTRIVTKYFMYSPNGYGNEYIALAQRLPIDQVYIIYVPRNDPERTRCRVSSSYSPTAVQRKLCEELDAKGTL